MKIFETSKFNEAIEMKFYYFIVNENENKPPVFLIDMGFALQQALEVHGRSGVSVFSRLLRVIPNAQKEKNIKLILGIGLTDHFVNVSGDYADIWQQRYRNIFSLTNTNFEGEPSASFLQIINHVS